MTIQITVAARERMQNFLATQNTARAVRFGVRKTGCSGFAYTVDLTDSIADNDHVFEQDGVTVVVDAKSLPLVDGTEIDFARQGLNSMFVFHNPNVVGACGCGESFSVG
jgi:iron-sulfur cluster assembly protein